MRQSTAKVSIPLIRTGLTELGRGPRTLNISFSAVDDSYEAATPTLTLEAAPEALVELSQITSGYHFSCGIRATDGSVYCWGQVNSTNTPIPTQIPSLTGVTDLSAGGYHACAIANSNQVKFWGSDIAIKNGDNQGITTPVEITGFSGTPAEVEVGFGHTCVRMTSGAVQCWGDGTSGQLGDGNGVTNLSPVTVVGVSNATQISTFGNHTCARKIGISTWLPPIPNPSPQGGWLG